MDTLPSLDASLWLDPNDVAAGQGDAWRSWLRTSFPQYSLLPSENPRAGGARLLSLGSARLWLVEFPAGMTLRGAPADHFRRDAFVSFQLRGSRRLSRDGRVFRIQAGEMSIGRAPRHGSETLYEEDTSLLLLEMPSPSVTARHPQIEHWSIHVCRSDQPGAALLHDLLARTLAVGERLAPHERSMALSAAVELLPLPIAGLRASNAHVSRVERILCSIDERLGETRLNPERLAQEQGISRRRLDELFMNALGTSVAACISERRLLRAARLLRDPACRGLSVASVGERVGFCDASHFSRAFRRRFGATPRAWRATE